MTAEEVRKQVAQKHGLGNLVTGHKVQYYHEAMIEFAKIHVKLALEKAADEARAYNRAEIGCEQHPSECCGKCLNVYRDSVIDAYPEELIK